MFSGGNRTFTP